LAAHLEEAHGTPVEKHCPTVRGIEARNVTVFD